MQVLEVAVASFTLPHGRRVEAEGGVELSQVRLIRAPVSVVLIPDHHVLQAVHVAPPPCGHRVQVDIGQVLHPPGPTVPTVRDRLLTPTPTEQKRKLRLGEMTQPRDNRDPESQLLSWPSDVTQKVETGTC